MFALLLSIVIIYLKQLFISACGLEERFMNSQSKYEFHWQRSKDTYSQNVAPKTAAIKTWALE